MFNESHKESRLEALIEKDGIDCVTDYCAEIVSSRLANKEIAYRFILEEIDGASQGNSASERFAMNSGIHPDEYQGALNNSTPEIDGPDGPQQLLVNFSLQLINSTNTELMAEFRCMIDDKIMQRFSLGKYGKEEDRPRQLLESLRNFLTDDRDVMPALTQNIPVLTDAPLRHVVNRKKNIASAKRLIIELSKITGEETDSIIRKALGKGTSTTPGGDEYVGARKDGNMHGQGTYTWASGSIYVGAWKDGNMHGQGTFTSANGDEYVGTWKDDVKHGQGTFTSASGKKYVGTWKDDVKHGQGTSTTPGGDEYVGARKDGNIHGQGTYTWASGSIYVGAWKDGIKHGQGTYTWASGDKYVGAWKDGIKHGQGTFTSASGKKYVGTWKDGILDN